MLALLLLAALLPFPQVVSSERLSPQAAQALVAELTEPRWPPPHHPPHDFRLSREDVALIGRLLVAGGVVALGVAWLGSRRRPC